jgi:hypothetical protein
LTLKLPLSSNPIARPLPPLPGTAWM